VCDAGLANARGGIAGSSDSEALGDVDFQADSNTNNTVQNNEFTTSKPNESGLWMHRETTYREAARATSDLKCQHCLTGLSDATRATNPTPTHRCRNKPIRPRTVPRARARAASHLMPAQTPGKTNPKAKTVGERLEQALIARFEYVLRVRDLSGAASGPRMSHSLVQLKGQLWIIARVDLQPAGQTKTLSLEQAVSTCQNTSPRGQADCGRNNRACLI
jgi:alpha-ketoglutarate-dependent taurine dioxygenase